MELSDIVEGILSAHDTTKVSLARTNLSFLKICTKKFGYIACSILICSVSFLPTAYLDLG